MAEPQRSLRNPPACAVECNPLWYAEKRFTCRACGRVYAFDPKTGKLRTINVEIVKPEVESLADIF